MMDTSGTTSPEGVEARWAESQMGTLLLHDSNNFKYQIHQKNLDWTKATQRCVKSNVSKYSAIVVLLMASSSIICLAHEHTLESDIILEAAREEEK
jgi:hypothetical protein